MEEVREKHIAKRVLCTTLIICMFAGNAFAGEISAAENKVAPMKSFFSRFLKFNKPEKKETPIKEETPLLSASVSLNMSDCIKIAIKNDPNIKLYKDTQNIQKNEVGVAKSSYFPTLFGGTGYYINNTKYSGDRSDSTNNNYYGLNLGINQLIWDFGYTNAKINMNKFNYEAASYDVENAILQSIYRTKIAYTAVLAAKANEDISERYVRINELNVERTNAMYEVGLKSKIDLVNAQVYLTEAKIALLKAQNVYQNKLIELNNSMYYIDAPDYSILPTETFNFQKNYSIKNEINVSYDRRNYDPDSIDAKIKDGAILTSGIEKKDILKTYSFKPFGLTMQEAIQKAYENRPDIKALELVKRASEEALKAVKRSALPAIGGSASYSYSGRSDYNSNAVGVFAGAQLPTINAMALKYQIEQGKSYLDIASLNVDLLKKNVYFSVQNYYINMKQLERRIPLIAEKVEQALVNFELADGRYAVGMGDYIELQQAQTKYNSAQLEFVQAVFDYNEARFYLEKAIAIK